MFVKLSRIIEFSSRTKPKVHAQEKSEHTSLKKNIYKPFSLSFDFLLYNNQLQNKMGKNEFFIIFRIFLEETNHFAYCTSKK